MSSTPNLPVLTDLHVQMMNMFKGVDPLVLSACSVFTGYMLACVWSMHRDDIGISARVRRGFFRLARRIPFIRNKIQDEIAKVEKQMMENIHGADKIRDFRAALPERGMEKDALVALVDQMNSMEGPQYLEGRVSGAVFNDEKDEAELELYGEVFKRFAWSNPLWPRLFPAVRKMEAEVVRMCCTMLSGDEESCGTMSTGGTISILLACLAHRNRALKRGVSFPEMIVPSSAHAAFFKAAEVFRIKFVEIPVKGPDFVVDVRAVRNAINSRTCMIVGSTPNFPFGTVDDIEGLAQLGLDYDIPVHVDACLGGFILPFIDHAPAFDFRVPGVSSISADTHKYGLTPKGSSVVVYRNKELLHNQYFCSTDWQGGIYASATLEGSRAGLNIALCWSSLMFQGRESYTNKASAIVDTTRKIRDGIESIPELELQGPSNICIVSWTSSKICIHRFSEIMNDNGWQLTNLQYPAGVHLMVTLNHAQGDVAEKFVQAARDTVAQMKKEGRVESAAAALYGMAAKIPDRSIVREFACTYLDACYSRPPPLKSD